MKIDILLHPKDSVARAFMWTNSSPSNAPLGLMMLTGHCIILPLTLISLRIKAWTKEEHHVKGLLRDELKLVKWTHAHLEIKQLRLWDSVMTNRPPPYNPSHREGVSCL